MKVLDVGCGENKLVGNEGDVVIGLDQLQIEGVDVVFDLEQKTRLPFNDDEFDLIHCWAILEHLNNVVFVVKELSRVCKPSGLIRVMVPHFASKDAFSSPFHVRFFSFNSFNPLFYGNCFELVRARFTFNKLFFVASWFANAFPGTYEKFFLFWFPPGGLLFELKPVAGGCVEGGVAAFGGGKEGETKKT